MMQRSPGWSWAVSLVLAIGLGSFASPAAAKIKVGEKPPVISLKEPEGALVKGGPWDSKSLKGKVHILFYVDPDEKDLNESLEAELKKNEFPEDKFASVAVINMKATWLPNSLIAMNLNSKQKEYPRTIYIKDFKKVFVDKWGLTDDSYHVVMLDKEGIVRFSQAGTLKPDQVKAFIALIQEYLAKE